MIRWASVLDEIRPGLDHPSTLIVPVAVLDTLPMLSGEQLADAAAAGAPSVWRRQALVALVVRTLGTPPADMRLRTRSDGRRFLAGTTVFTRVTYRSGVVAAALARVPLGIDIKSRTEAAVAESIALEDSDGDIEALISWHGPAGMWAAKEAALKACGKDLTNYSRWRFGDAVIMHDPIPLCAFFTQYIWAYRYCCGNCIKQPDFIDAAILRDRKRQVSTYIQLRKSALRI